MAAPYEVIASPLTVYVAPVATAFPAVNASPSGSWFKLGTSGTKNYDDSGVHVQHSETLNPWTPVGNTGPRKVFRSAESLMIGFTLVDLTIEQYAKILNDAAVTTAAGPPATKSIPLIQGLVVATFALLARGVSPISDSLPAQYQVPVVYQSDSPNPVFKKDVPASLACSFTALQDDTNGFGTLVIQTA